MKTSEKLRTLEEKYNGLLEKYNNSLESKCTLEAKLTDLKDQLIDSKTQNYRLAMNNFISPERSPELRSNERSLNTDFLRMSSLIPNQNTFFQNFKVKPQKNEMRGSLKLNSVSLENYKYSSSPPIKDHKINNNLSFKSDYQKYQKSRQNSDINIKDFEQSSEGDAGFSR